MDNDVILYANMIDELFKEENDIHHDYKREMVYMCPTP